MKLRRARFGVLLIAVGGLVIATMPPASATSVRASVFAGSLQFGAPLRSVAEGVTTCASANPLDCVTVTTGPLGEPHVEVTGGDWVAFDFRSTLCFSLTASTPGDPAGAGAALCELTAAGAVRGFDGSATGVGTLTYTDTFGVGKAHTFSTGFGFTIVGNVMTIVADSNEEVFRAVVALTPGSNPQERRASGLSGRTR